MTHWVLGIRRKQDVLLSPGSRHARVEAEKGMRDRWANRSKGPAWRVTGSGHLSLFWDPGSLPGPEGP